MRNVIRTELYGRKVDLGIKLDEYGDGSPAVQLIDVDTAEPFAVLSVCLPTSVLLGEGVFYAKHWSENEPVFEMMARGGYIERVPGRPESSGFIDRIYAYRLTAKGKECVL